MLSKHFSVMQLIAIYTQKTQLVYQNSLGDSSESVFKHIRHFGLPFCSVKPSFKKDSSYDLFLVFLKVIFIYLAHKPKL